jgi:hypothetical protein
LPARDVDPSGSRIALESIRSAVETLGGEVKQQSDAARCGAVGRRSFRNHLAFGPW